MLEDETESKHLSKKLSNTIHLMKRKKIDHDHFKKTFDSLEDKKDSTEHTPKSGEVDYLSMLVISKDSDWKTVFDIIMLFASVYSTFM